MKIHKDIWTLSITNVLLLSGVIFAYLNGQHELAFVAALMLVMSLIPHYLKGIHNIHIPLIFVYGAILFIFASIMLGQFSEFYDKFHWYDAFLHFISATIFGIIGFLIIYVFYTTNRLRIPHFLIILFAFSFALMIGAIWEILEFIIDKTLKTNLQVGSLEDTMVDLLLDAIGALIISIVGYLYLKNIPIPIIEPLVDKITQDVVAENEDAAGEVKNSESV